MKTLLTVVAVCGSLLLSGCLGADTSDPRKGGLFGYSPKTYEQRIQTRESQYQQLSDENARLKQESATLEQQKKQKQANVTAQKKKLGQVNAEIKSMKGKISKTQATPASESGISEAEKAAQIRRMQKELQKLEAEADALSRL
ncbi:MAG: hypothetical protein J6I40_07460 [Mailhella sp.]|nr:hypothetical protein [Mailhella sp.]